MEGHERNPRQVKRAVILRRLFLLSLVFVAGAVAIGDSVEYFDAEEIAQVKCPPGDIGGWKYDPGKRRADRGEWHVVSRRQLHCGLGDLCATVEPDPVYGGNYGRIYATAPSWAYRESLVQHEICHWKGWSHDGWRQRREDFAWRR